MLEKTHETTRMAFGRAGRAALACGLAATCAVAFAPQVPGLPAAAPAAAAEEGAGISAERLAECEKAYGWCELNNFELAAADGSGVISADEWWAWSASDEVGDCEVVGSVACAYTDDTWKWYTDDTQWEFGEGFADVTLSKSLIESVSGLGDGVGLDFCIWYVSDPEAYEAQTPEERAAALGALEAEVMAEIDEVTANGRAAAKADEERAVAERAADDEDSHDNPSDYGNRAVTSVTVNAKTVTAKAVKKALGANASTVTKVTLGKKVRKVSARAFKGTRVRTLVVKTRKLAKKRVKNALKGSKVKTVQVKVGSKKANAKYVKKYKKVFAKKVVGKKVKVK